MWLALASVIALLFLHHDTRGIIQKAFVMLMVSLIGWMKWSRLALRRTRGCREYLSERYTLVTEVFHNYRTGAVSRDTLFEFVLFKARVWATQYFENGHLESVERGVYDLVYYDGDRRFHVRFPKRRGVRQIVKATTPNDEDVTGQLIAFLGPGHNFHGIPTTPRLLGWTEGIKIQYRNGTEVEYSSDETIQLTPNG